MEENNLSDTVNEELDHRKIQQLVDDGVLDAGDLANNTIVSLSPCCKADLVGDEIGNGLLIRCSKCGGPLNPSYKGEEDV